jgi:hypothetical protein
VKWPPACEDVKTGAREHPLAKTQQTEKKVRAIVNSRVCELAIAL